MAQLHTRGPRRRSCSERLRPDELMRCAERNDVHYVIGVTPTERLVAHIEAALAEVEAQAMAAARPRALEDFPRKTHESRSRSG